MVYQVMYSSRVDEWLSCVIPCDNQGRGFKRENPSLGEVYQITALVGAGMVLLITVVVGIVAHELSHAAVLYLFGIEHDISIRPDRTGTSQFDANTPGAWAVVVPREISPETPAWVMRLSSIAPLALAVPFLAVFTGVVPDPLQAESLLLTAWTVGWLACAIPSPQDFSVFWHAERAIAEHTADPSEG